MSSYGLPAVLREFEIKNVEMTDRSIDVGVFGTSYEGSWIGAPCAVKKLHTSDAKDGYISDRFVYECKIWCELKHPNIIQFFGICVSPKENCPMLVCELQRDNLSRFLSNKTRESVPLSIKASILKDVALAMRYLHSLDPIVLYRDLNASYIYLTANLTAKLGDFGSASKLDLGKKATLPPTGKTDFPEPYCSVSADSFTYGELILHILIHEFPKPSPKVVDGHSDKTMVLKEFDRRKAYTSTLNSQEKQFLPLIARCLQDNPDNRPNFNEILDIVDTYLCVLDSEASKNVKATKLLHLMSELGYKEKELHSVKAELARLRMSLTSIVMGGEGESHRQSLPLKLRGPPPEPPPRLDKARSLKSRFSTSPPKVAKKPPTTSMETLVDQGYVSVTPSVRGSLISTADTSEDDYLEMNKPSSSPEVPKSLSPGLTSPLHNSKQLPSSRTSPKVGPPPTRSSMSSLDTDDDYSSVKTREAVVKKDYKTLKYADRVQVLKWMPESCLVQNERTGRPEYIPPEYLAELKPIENEIWFTQMNKMLLEEHIRKPYIPNGSYVVRKGTQGYVLVLKHGGRPHAYQIFERDDRTYSLNVSGTPNYVTISELIKSYTSRQLGLVGQMSLPFISQRSEVDRESLKMDKEINQGHRFTIWSGTFAERNGLVNMAAIKTVAQSQQRDKENSAALFAELSVLNYLNRLGPHPNILKLFGVCFWLNQPFLAVEYCDEGSLLQFVRKYALNLRDEHLQGYSAQIASAMAFVEESGLVHRDLKASSVLIDGCGMCKLSSFRHSCTLAKTKEDIAAKIYLATADPRWIAPEVLMSAGSMCTSKSDVWSFGIVMMELFSKGLLPYEDIPDCDITTKIIDGEVPRVPRNTPSEIRAIMKSCFESNPVKRPSFAALEEKLTTLVV